MPVLQEGELEFTFPAGTHAVKFDGPNHGLSHCMKAVDFIVDFGSYFLFVEVKDPDNTIATSKHREQFAVELSQPNFTRKLSLKYRDSFLYHWAENKSGKPVKYVVLLQLETLRSPQYLVIHQALKIDLPETSLPKAWSRTLVGGSAVLDMSMWNAIGIYGTVRRV